ncbi:lipoprotein [Azorhizobium sp. AG788]|uniref:LPS translocon maturation chaperone LptM n=1 Tax=Azorhizobium sp. AG788 TaxID=2183897 RepID=UPI0031396D08
MSRRFRTPAALILILACAGMLAGCGVKGPLEPPPKAAAGTPQASTGAVSGASAAAGEASSESSWNINQASIVADTGTAAPPLSTTPPAPTASTSAGSSQQRTKSTHVGGTSSAPTSLDQITRPNTPFILDGLL